MAYFKNKAQSTCAHIVCDDEYKPAKVKTGNHGPLTVRVADHSVDPWQWRKLKAQFATLDQAKAGLTDFLVKYPHFVPAADVVVPPADAKPPASA